MSTRFEGEAYIDFSDGKKELRQTIVLAPYVQTSESLRDIDYSHALVVDAQSMEFDFKTQLYEMVNNQEALSYNTFLEYAHKSSFRNGSNVLQWLHEKNQIKRVRAEDAYIVIGNGGNAQRFRIDEINKSIREQNEAKLEAAGNSAYSDPSMNAENVQPATIEGRRPSEQATNLTESAQPSQEAPDATQPASSEEIDLSTVPGVTLFDENGNPTKPAQAQPAVEVATQSVDVAMDSEAPDSGQPTGLTRDEIEGRFEKIESLLNKKNKDTVVTRLINRYDLTEAEAIKALESAGKRKEKKKQKQQESDDA